MGDNLDVFLWVESAKNGTLHDDASDSVDIALSGNQLSGWDAVSCTHLDGRTRVVTGGNSLVDTRAKRIPNTSDGVKSRERSSYRMLSTKRGWVPGGGQLLKSQ